MARTSNLQYKIFTQCDVAKRRIGIKKQRLVWVAVQRASRNNILGPKLRLQVATIAKMWLVPLGQDRARVKRLSGVAVSLIAVVEKETRS